MGLFRKKKTASEDALQQELDALEERLAAADRARAELEERLSTLADVNATLAVRIATLDEANSRPRQRDWAHSTRASACWVISSAR